MHAGEGTNDEVQPLEGSAEIAPDHEQQDKMYRLTDPRNGKPFYVGRSNNPGRYNEYLRDAARHPETEKGQVIAGLAHISAVHSPPRPVDKDITRMDQHTKRGIAELCQTHRLTRLYAARRPLTCGGCGALIATNELFTRPTKGADGSNPRPLCRRCQPFVRRPDLDLGGSSRILALPKTPGQWLVFIVTLGICAWHGLLAGVLVGVALATALVVVPRLARRWRRRRTTV